MRNPGARLPLAACLALAALSACREELPLVGPQKTPPDTTASTGPRIAITGASVSPTARTVVATFRLEKDGTGLTLEEAGALEPRWTLAVLEKDPATGTPAWKSLVLTGVQTMPSLPIAGPGTPPEYVIANARQPGSESGVGEYLGGGDFKFTFATALPVGFDPAATYRVGVFLEGVARATDGTVATSDFVPGGGALSVRDTVLDASCGGCHGVVRVHGAKRMGVRLCLTCHTWQNADPDTVDPAATSGATPATNPNPLDLGRIVHRIHRGKNLPTLYKANGTAAAPSLPSATPLPLPFHPSRTTGTTPKNPPVVTLSPVPPAQFSVEGDRNELFVFGKILSRIENDQPARTVPAGVSFPRDLRDCDACHAGAPQQAVVTTELHRRTCQGCHPDVWFGDGTTTSLPSPDEVHVPHPGGPQVDDSKCRDCHTRTGATAYAPIELAHVVPFKSPYYNAPLPQFVAVTSFQPGQRPVVFLKLSDEDGPIVATNTTTKNAGATPSPIVRAISPTLDVAGPTTDYLWTLSGTTTTSPFSESLPAGSAAVPRDCTPGVSTDPACVCTPVAPATTCRSTASLRTCTPGASDPLCTCTPTGTATTCPVVVDAPPPPAECTLASPCYRLTFRNTLSPAASGTWGIALEGRRTSPSRSCTPGPADPGCVCTPTAPATTCNSTATKHYVVTTDPLTPIAPELQFPWPYTGESLTEVMPNPIVYVDTAAGTLGGGTPVPRRQIVADENCNKCHLRLTFHGGRVSVALCDMCHTPNRTDWSSRTKDAAGNVDLSKTFDGREETSIHMKVMIHRLHTGKHQGTASLDLLLPYSVGGRNPYFFDDNQFPNDLANCTVCHAADCYSLADVPKGLEPTVANETFAIRHLGVAAHPDDDVRTPPITAACNSCHATAYSLRHAIQYTTAAGVEQCVQCHKTGAYGVKKVHGIPETAAQ